MDITSKIGGDIGAIVNIIKEVIFGITEMVQDLGTKVQGIVKETVAAFRPMEIIKFTAAIQDLRAVIGEAFVPVLQFMTKVVRDLADWFINLSTPVKQLVGWLSKAAIIAGAFVGAVLAVGGVLVTLALLIGTGIGPAVLVVIAAFGGWIAILHKIGYLGEALKMAEQAITMFVQGVQAVWESLAPVRTELTAAFGDLKAAFSELYEAVKPVAVVIIAGLVIGLRIALGLIITALTWFVQALAFVVKRIAALVNAIMKFAGLGELKLPDLGSKDRSSFGMGQHSAEIGTDLGGLKTKLEQQIIERQSGPSSMDQTAANTKRTADLLDKVVNALTNPAGAVRDVAGSAAAGYATSGIGGAIANGIGAIFN